MVVNVVCEIYCDRVFGVALGNGCIGHKDGREWNSTVPTHGNTLPESRERPHVEFATSYRPTEAL